MWRYVKISAWSVSMAAEVSNACTGVAWRDVVLKHSNPNNMVPDS
jgi:hypothetical protein